MIINEIDVGELVALMDSNPNNIQIVDVRQPQEVAAGAIAGINNIPMVSIPLRANEISEDKQVILVCRSGARSGQCTAWLMQNGKTNVHNLRGGMIAWANNGLQIELQQTA